MERELLSRGGVRTPFCTIKTDKDLRVGAKLIWKNCTANELQLGGFFFYLKLLLFLLLCFYSSKVLHLNETISFLPENLIERIQHLSLVSHSQNTL